MKQILATLAAVAAFALPAAAQTHTASCDTTVKARYIYNPSKDPSTYGLSVRRQAIYVNEDVTTHIVMPENIKLVDISTKDIVGNQCSDNIVRVKPAHRMMPNELLGTITVIGERHLAQYNVIYAAGPNKADALYNVQQEDMKRYSNPQVGMPEGTMARYAWAIYGTGGSSSTSIPAPMASVPSSTISTASTTTSSLTSPSTTPRRSSTTSTRSGSSSPTRRRPSPRTRRPLSSSPCSRSTRPTASRKPTAISWC
jgi:hypothetical protein